MSSVSLRNSCQLRKRKDRQRGVLAAIGSAACWGFATVMTKGVLTHLPPITLLTVQLTTSILVLWLVTFCLRSRLNIDASAGRASLTGFLEPGLAYTFGIIGLALTTASNTALIGAAEPMLILVLAWLMLKERLGPTIALLAATATCGLLLVVLPTRPQGFAGASFLGDSMVFMGTLFGALYVIATRAVVTETDPLPLCALQQTVGLFWTLAVLGLAAIAGSAPLDSGDLSPAVLALAASSGVIQYGAAFWLYLYALQRLPANVASFYLMLIPVFGVAGAFVFLGEGLSGPQWLGSLLILASVGIVSRIRHE